MASRAWSGSISNVVCNSRCTSSQKSIAWFKSAIGHASCFGSDGFPVEVVGASAVDQVIERLHGRLRVEAHLVGLPHRRPLTPEVGHRTRHYIIPTVGPRRVEMSIGPTRGALPTVLYKAPEPLIAVVTQDEVKRFERGESHQLHPELQYDRLERDARGPRCPRRNVVISLPCPVLRLPLDARCVESLTEIDVGPARARVDQDRGPGLDLIQIPACASVPEHDIFAVV